jgi:hypothetical protein
MSSAEQLVTEAYRMLGAIDSHDTAPAPADMKLGLDRLTRMIDGWALKGLNVVTTSVVCNFSANDTLIRTTTDNFFKVAKGLNVSGAGVSSRVAKLDPAGQALWLELPTTQAGDAVTLTFTLLPLQARFMEAVAALLAKRLQLKDGELPAWAQEIAIDGWRGIQANYMPVFNPTFDIALRSTSTQVNNIIPSANDPNFNNG